MWRVDVTAEGREALAQFDAGLLDEFRDRMADMAEEPGMFLRRSSPPEPAGLWVLEYESDLSPGLRVVALLDEWDPAAKRLKLVGVMRLMGG
ncbi:MAG: hypothetical protein R3B68_14330 [Phycisphaerales bacterium]